MCLENKQGKTAQNKHCNQQLNSTFKGVFLKRDILKREK